MKRTAACRAVALGALAVLFAASPARGQSNVKVVTNEVVDDRISEGFSSGGLSLVMNLEGDGLDAVRSARIRMKSAKADTGQNLLAPSDEPPAYRDRNVNAGRIEVSLIGPPRAASSVSVSGTADLFVPGRDPESTVKVPGVLARLDKPVVSKGLKAAKVDVTLLSKAKYVEERKKNKLDEKKIAAIRAEGKEHGAKDEQIDAMIEMAKAFEKFGEGDLPEHGLFLRIPRAASEKIQDLWLETAAGERIDTGGSSATSDESAVLKQVEYRAAIPADAVLVVSLFTDKAVVSLPFEMKEVPLP